MSKKIANVVLNGMVPKIPYFSIGKIEKLKEEAA